jgi:hypothetical protein
MCLRKLVCIAIAAVPLWLGDTPARAGTDWELTEHGRVLDVVNHLFIETDNKNWSALEHIFAPKVRFDVTSLAGGKPSTMSGKQIAAAWKKRLDPVKQVHHQTSNYLVKIDTSGKRAKVFCHVTVMHYRPEHEKRSITTFVGSYDLHLVQTKGRWFVDGFKFNKKFVFESPARPPKP